MHRSSVTDVLHSFTELERKLHIARWFRDAPPKVPSLFSKHLPRSGWMPRPHPEIQSFCRLVRKELVEKYHPKVSQPNITWLDRQAMSWLRSNRSRIMVVDADKNLGDVLIERSWIHTELNRLLTEGFTRLPQNDAHRQLQNARTDLEGLICYALRRGFVNQREADFLLSGATNMKPGTFRLRLKIHKVPMKGRPIANMSHSWLAPAGLFLCQHLLPLQQKLQFAVSSSFQFLQRMPVVVDKDYEIATIDIQNLYPSIDTEDLISSITALLHDFYSDKPLFAQVLCNLLTLVLRNQLVLHRGEFFAAFGIATGLSPGVFLANLYLDALDKKVADTHVDHLAFYARLVDDSLVCSSNIDGILDELLETRNRLDHQFEGWALTHRSG